MILITIVNKIVREWGGSLEFDECGVCGGAVFLMVIVIV